VTVVGVVLGNVSETEDHLGEFVEWCGSQPTHRSLEAREAGGGLRRSVTKIDSDGGGGGGDIGAVYSKSEFFRRPLPSTEIDSLLRRLVTDQLPGPARELSFTPMGGSYNRISPEATAFCPPRGTVPGRARCDDCSKRA
jgi:hypothetical protein